MKIVREWSNERVQWGVPIGKHEAVAHKIAFIAGLTFAMEAVVELSSLLADEERNDIRIEAALAKLYCSEMAWLVADEMVQITRRPWLRDRRVALRAAARRRSPQSRY